LLLGELLSGHIERGFEIKREVRVHHLEERPGSL
jgi:hypothetical protein